VPKQGFVPGEVIRFRVELNNGSGRDVTKMEVCLMQNFLFHAQGDSKKANRKVAVVLYPGQINANSTLLWDDGAIVIPPPLCSSFNGICRIIQLNYSIVFRFSVSGPSMDTSCIIPCVIGTIPLTTNEYSSASQPSADSQALSYGPSAFEPTPGQTNRGHEAADKDEMIQSDAACKRARGRPIKANQYSN
jgi:hypothetical protein